MFFCNPTLVSPWLFFVVSFGVLCILMVYFVVFLLLLMNFIIQKKRKKKDGNSLTMIDFIHWLGFS